MSCSAAPRHAVPIRAVPRCAAGAVCGAVPQGRGGVPSCRRRHARSPRCTTARPRSRSRRRRAVRPRATPADARSPPARGGCTRAATTPRAARAATASPGRSASHRACPCPTRSSRARPAGERATCRARGRAPRSRRGAAVECRGAHGTARCEGAAIVRRDQPGAKVAPLGASRGHLGSMSQPTLNDRARSGTQAIRRSSSRSIKQSGKLTLNDRARSSTLAIRQPGNRSNRSIGQSYPQR